MIKTQKENGFEAGPVFLLNNMFNFYYQSLYLLFFVFLKCNPIFCTYFVFFNRREGNIYDYLFVKYLCDKI